MSSAPARSPVAGRGVAVEARRVSGVDGDEHRHTITHGLESMYERRGRADRIVSEA